MATAGHASKRELIETALEALGPIDDEFTRWATRRAIVRMARMAREASRNERSVGREELRKKLEEITAAARALRGSLDNNDVRRALFHVAAANSPGADPAPPKAYTKIDRLPNFLKDLPWLLGRLEEMTSKAVHDFELRGRRGNVTPWETRVPTAKLLLATCGMALFQAARDLERWPGPKHPQLHQLLELTWEAATGEADAMDWTTILRTATAKKYRDETLVAILSARREAQDLVDDMARWKRGRHSVRRAGMAPRGRRTN